MAQVNSDLAEICQAFEQSINSNRLKMVTTFAIDQANVFVYDLDSNPALLVAIFSTNNPELIELYLYSEFRTWDVEWELATKIDIARDFAEVVLCYEGLGNWHLTPPRDFEKMPHPENLKAGGFDEFAKSLHAPSQVN